MSRGWRRRKMGVHFDQAPAHFCQHIRIATALVARVVREDGLVNSLKPLLTVAVLAGIGYGVYIRLNAGANAPPPPVEAGWNSSPDIQLPGETGSAPWGAPAVPGGGNAQAAPGGPPPAFQTPAGAAGEAPPFGQAQASTAAPPFAPAGSWAPPEAVASTAPPGPPAPVPGTNPYDQSAPPGGFNGDSYGGAPYDEGPSADPYGTSPSSGAPS